MPATLDVTRTAPRKVLIVVANPSVSTTLGWPVGFWGSELTHPYYEFSEAGYEVTVASPEGGRCELDAFSDPRDESGYSAEDLITMGFLSTPSLAALLEDTPSSPTSTTTSTTRSSFAAASRRCSPSATTPTYSRQSALSTRRRSRRPRSATVSPR